ncbi:hypothetical protein H310_01283 [Aphanomyces invadans]|uniref:PDZ domain-containing protein n=1 Tax=Aphanomyces invadans TaxID=157072 RepID=A0A024URF9_9STRA|nr:hypothetical protein H310_01283 [Aphanomyces invadans]ETW08765.1 hypothetical protein H310_01283 [Aphanomyces invadans]|eukprot:XP_008862570.1 hypothetical protein H310_01283 [Aphanomyces invadans]
MGLLDLFGPSQESQRVTDSMPALSSRPHHHTPEAFQEPVDLNTAWRYFRHDLTCHNDAETALLDAPPAAFTLWTPRSLETNLLHLSVRLEHGIVEHSILGMLAPGFHLVLPCIKAGSSSHATACGMCVRIVDLDVYLRIHHVHATVGCRADRHGVRVFERVSWALSPPKYTSTSMSLLFLRQDVFSMLRFVHVAESSVVVSEVQPHSAAAVAGIRPGFRIVHVDDVNVTSVHQLWTRLTTTSESLYVSLHFQENLVGDLYQVTLHNTGSIADWSRCGIKCRRVFDMVFVTESKGYGQHCGISRGSYIVAVNGTRVPFMGFEALTEFIAGSPHYRLPLTLDLLDSSNQDSVIIETERLLMTASLSVFHMAKATEQLRQLFLTVHEAMLVPLGLADVVDTCGLAALGNATRNAMLPFLAATRSPSAADMVRLIKTLKSRFRQACVLGPVVIQFTCIALFTCCFVDDKLVHRETTWSFRELVKILPLNAVLLYAAPLINRMKTSAKSIVRLASIGLLAEFIQRIHKKMLARGHDHHDRRRVMLVDMEDLRWRHQMLEAGIMFAELSTDIDPSVSCAARQYLPSMVADLMPIDVNWGWIVPLIEVLSKALMPDGRLDALYLCLQLAHHQPMTAFWRTRLAVVFAGLANDGNDSIRKAAAEKFVDVLAKLNVRDISDAYDNARLDSFSRRASSSCLVMSDVKEHPAATESACGSAESNISEVRRRCMTVDATGESPTAEDSTHILFTLLDAFTNLLQEAPLEIQKIACRNVRPVAALFGRDILCKFLVPAIQDMIVTDMHDCKNHGSSAVYDSVHHILARELCCVTTLLADVPEFIISDILPFLDRLFRNTGHTHILIEVLENFDSLGFALGKPHFLEHLAPLLVHIVDAPEWKLRVALAYNFAPLLRWLGVDEFMEIFQSAMETLSTDGVYQVRRLAYDAWVALMESSTSHANEAAWRVATFTFVGATARDGNHHLRISCLHFYAAVSHMLSTEEIESEVVPVLSLFCKDPVPNVRVVVARELTKMSLPPAHRTALSTMLQGDADLDVKIFTSLQNSDN